MSDRIFEIFLNRQLEEGLELAATSDIVDLLRYDENSAGGLMAKELVKVNENWNVLTCVKEMRQQAENVTRVVAESRHTPPTVIPGASLLPFRRPLAPRAQDTQAP